MTGFCMGGGDHPASAEPFGGPVETGKHGVWMTLLVQWLAPLASIAQFIVACSLPCAAPASFGEH